MNRLPTQTTHAVAMRLRRGWTTFGQRFTKFPQAIAVKLGLSRAALKEVIARAFFFTWPLIWRLLALLNLILPEKGRLRQAFTDIVFTLPWNKWHRSAYIPEYRDLFFEYILTFVYAYPIRKGDVVVQVGASFGEETARFAKSVGPKGRVIAVEPEATNIQRLRSSFPEERFPQVTIIPKGASNKRGQASFFVGGEREHRLADIPGRTLTYEWWGVTDHLAKGRYKKTITIPVDMIDNILAAYSLDRIDFVLIETNGSELEIIQGMNDVLSITKRLGARGHVMRDGVPIYMAIEELLRKKGFKTTITSEHMVLAKRGKL